MSETAAYILNVGLNAFLTSPNRETLLLDALRQNKSVRVRFSASTGEQTYQVLQHPEKPLVYRLEPVDETTPVSIELQPFLDGPVAFQVAVESSGRRFSYNIDWSGKIC